MTSTSSPRDTRPRLEPVAAPRALPQRQISRRMLAAAVMMVGLGAILSYFAFTSVAGDGSYLAATRAVPAGTTLTASDLHTERARVEDMPVIPAARLREVIGQRTTVSLSKGQLVSPDGITRAPVLQAGQRQVGLALEPGRMPAAHLRAGDRLTLVETAAAKPGTSSASTPDTAEQTLSQWDATVVGSSAPSPTDNSVVVYVAVNESDAAEIGALGVANRLVVLLVEHR